MVWQFAAALTSKERNCILPHFSPQMLWYPITILSHHCNSPTDSGEEKVESCIRQTTLLNTRPLNPEASCTNVLEETLFNWRPKSACRCPAHHKESLERDEPSKAPPAKPSNTPDEAGPIVHRPMGVPVTAGCDTAWDRNRRPIACFLIWRDGISLHEVSWLTPCYLHPKAPS